jgi:hypothetical protein
LYIDFYVFYIIFSIGGYSYVIKKRIIDKEIQKNLQSGGAVLIKGPKFCGKPFTAMQFAKSRLQVDTDPKVKILMDFNPETLLDGDTPRLIDEWQEQSHLWEYIRHVIDKRKNRTIYFNRFSKSCRIYKNAFWSRQDYCLSYENNVLV